MRPMSAAALQGNPLKLLSASPVEGSQSYHLGEENSPINHCHKRSIHPQSCREREGAQQKYFLIDGKPVWLRAVGGSSVWSVWNAELSQRTEGELLKNCIHVFWKEMRYERLLKNSKAKNCLICTAESLRMVCVFKDSCKTQPVWFGLISSSIILARWSSQSEVLVE